MSDSQGGRSHLPLSKHILVGFLRLFFKLLYHQFAWSYDWVASIVSLGAWQRWVCTVLPYLDGPRTLEIGFGPGHLLAALQHKGIAPFGLDESPQMTRIARRRLLGVDPHPGLVRGVAEHLPFATESLDQVVMTFPAEFIFHQMSLMEIKRVLAKNGKVVVLPVAWITGRKPWERFAAWVNHITGQAPEWNPRVLQPVKDLGFEVTSQVIDLGSSKVLLIQLTQSLANPDD
ncbi:MAG TPA: class I SAM-dependent methyltransferase [Anaerolineales bacterium]